jgi:hypothetical protein
VSKDIRKTSDDLSDLEEQLRRLPGPTPSLDLEQRLLSGIPEIKIVRRTPWQRGRRVCVYAAITAAALLLGIVLFPWDEVDTPTGTARQHSALLNNTSPQLVLGTVISPHSQETRPCDILPPFPDLR